MARTAELQSNRGCLIYLAVAVCSNNGRRFAEPRAGVTLARNVEHFEPDVVRQVLGYFVRNRRTADTLEGIARWRLLQERVEKSVRETKAAVGWLVREGYLDEIFPPGANVPVFRLNPERRGDAVRFIDKVASADKTK